MDNLVLGCIPSTMDGSEIIFGVVATNWSGYSALFIPGKYLKLNFKITIFSSPLKLAVPAASIGM